MDIESQITELGNNLLTCRLNCSGIKLNPEKGILPRCLYYESRSDALGVVIVGINPGIASKDEMEFFMKNGSSYEQIFKYWDENIGKKHQYYFKLRNLTKQLSLNGPILWTELVKCQKDSNRPLTLRNYPETFRTCTKKFLLNELQMQNIKKWPLIAVGGGTYEALAFRFPDRPILGVPHPTSSRGHFSKLFSKKKELKKRFLNQAKDILNGTARKATWLFNKTD